MWFAAECPERLNILAEYTSRWYIWDCGVTSRYLFHHSSLRKCNTSRPVFRAVGLAESIRIEAVIYVGYSES